MPAYNARFAVPAAEPGSAFVPYGPADRGRALRPGGSRGRRRQLRLLAPAEPPDSAPAHRRHYVRATVRVHQYLTGGSPSSTARAVSPLRPERTPDEVVAQSPESARRPKPWIVDKQVRCHKPHRPTTAKEADNSCAKNADIFTRYEQGAAAGYVLRLRRGCTGPSCDDRMRQESRCIPGDRSGIFAYRKARWDTGRIHDPNTA